MIPECLANAYASPLSIESTRPHEEMPSIGVLVWSIQTPKIREPRTFTLIINYLSLSYLTLSFRDGNKNIHYLALCAYRAYLGTSPM